MFLNGFVNELAIVDNDENKRRIIAEAIDDAEVIDPSEAVTMDLFGNKEHPTITRNIDPEFEKILVSMDIPDNMPEEHKRDYITDIIDNSMGITHPEPIIAPAVAIPVTEDASTVTTGNTKSGKTLTMNSADKKELLAIISKYNEDTQNKTKNGNILKTFIRNVLSHLSQTQGKISAGVESCIDLMYDKFVIEGKRSQVSNTAKKTNSDKNDAVAELRQKLNDIAKNIR